MSIDPNKIKDIFKKLMNIYPLIHIIYYCQSGHNGLGGPKWDLHNRGRPWHFGCADLIHPELGFSEQLGPITNTCNIIVAVHAVSDVQIWAAQN